MSTGLLTDLKDFISEASKNIDEIESTVLTLEKEQDNQELVNKIFRHVHSIKGDSAYTDIKSIGELSHILESILNNLRGSYRSVNNVEIDLIYSYIDCMRTNLEELRKLCKKKPIYETSVFENLDNSEGIMELTAEMKEFLSRSALTENSNEIEIDDKINKYDLGQHFQYQDSNQEYINIKTEKIEKLCELAGELSIVQSIIMEKSLIDKKIGTNLGKDITNLKKISEEIQKGIMETRLSPLDYIFKRIGRVVRDIAKKENKNVEFKVSGGDTEIDKTIIQELPTILGHLIRNSIDHGIETEEERKNAGKNIIGTIQVNAFHERNAIIIEVKDDGRGISINELKKIARKKKLIKYNNEYTDEDILNLIFLPGFSTNKNADEISGRGVGLDVVKKGVEDFRGKVSVKTTENIGTTFRMEFPESTAIIDNLVVKIGGNKYLIPAASVNEIVNLDKDKISSIKGKKKIINIRDSFIELVMLDELIGLSTKENVLENSFVVIIQSGNIRKGFIVEEVVDKQQIIMKNAEDSIFDSELVSGFTILGDGNVAVILNVNEILNDSF